MLTAGTAQLVSSLDLLWRTEASKGSFHGTVIEEKDIWTVHSLCVRVCLQASCGGIWSSWASSRRWPMNSLASQRMP